jgi:hypothetical protein
MLTISDGGRGKALVAFFIIGPKSDSKVTPSWENQSKKITTNALWPLDPGLYRGCTQLLLHLSCKSLRSPFET